MKQEAKIKTIHSAVKILASMCDGAMSEDGMGFNKFDAHLGKKFAALERLTPGQALYSYKMIRKYRGQLERHGLDYDLLEPPEVEKKKKQQRVLRKLNGKVEIRFDYSETIIQAIKSSVPGRKWNPKAKMWTAPFSMDTIIPLMEIASTYDFHLDPEFAEAVEVLLSEATDREQASRATDSDFEAKGLNGELYPFQKAGVEYAVNAKRCFIGDAMGLGKTIQALAAIEHLEAYPALIVCPASVKLNWKREAEKWLQNIDVSVLNGRVPNTEDLLLRDIVIINYDILDSWKHELEETGFRSIVFDESQKIKNYKAKRTKAAKLLAKGIEYRFCLSGTVILNRPQELISQLQVLGYLSYFGGFWNFAKRYCAAYQAAFGWDMSGASNLEELNIKLRQKCYVRREKEEVLKELPPKQRTDIPIELSNRLDYDKAEFNLIEWLADKSIDDEWLLEIEYLDPEEQEELMEERREESRQRTQRAEALVRIEALKQLAAEGKIESVLTWIEDFLESGEKLVVFATHRDIVKRIAQVFEAPTIMGGDSVTARQKVIDAFQENDDCRLIVCNTQAAGIGITLTAASNVAFVELGWTPAEHDQAEDRCHRIGQEDSVNAYYFLGQNTIDEEISSLLNEKRIVVDATLKGIEVSQKDLDVLSRLVKTLLDKRGS
jgi:SNF2 family DNA or RNA helicase